ncbi:aspartic proteinase Asp1-like [Bidens hawaiensis]|uniref:aspartic proteinase Asp1-like n=1 Tax=Bidens hawaiensis TaxID=980011 RepID=UPI0040494B94
MLSPFGASGSTAAGSSATVFFQVTGNVYPHGHYYVNMTIGNPPNTYFLDIDTGSDLTWVQCDAPCVNCLPAPHPPYKPSKDLVKCDDSLCEAFHSPVTPDCAYSPDQCDYDITYADNGVTTGVLVKDWFPLLYSNGTVTAPRLAFGCGYDQTANGETSPYLDGILGLGFGEVGILNQLQELGVTKNVVAHCFSSQGDGYLFFGDQLVLATWIPYIANDINGRYSLGTAEVFVGEISSGITGLPVVFDSGSTYTYFSGNAYRVIASMLMSDIQGKKLNKADDDNTLPMCWKGSEPFISIQEVRNFFKPIVLTFENSNVGFQMDPEGYLIITEKGNACLGILDGTEAGLEGLIVIGDISFQDKLIVYDNVRKRIGWAPANCNNIPK